MLDLDKIRAINRAVDEYFDLNKSVNEIRAKDLMPWFIKKGLFSKDHRKGRPIRYILRELDKVNQLNRIPRVFVIRKVKNRNWFFIRSNDSI